VNTSSLVRGYVLAGGASSRFGTDKALAELQGKSMLARTVDIVASVCSDVAIVAAESKVLDKQARNILDRWPGEGPLGGILTALLDVTQNSSQELWCLVVSCDMPFLTQEWLAFLATRASESSGEAIVPQNAGRMEPLCACWKSSASAAISAMFDAGTRKVTDVLKTLRTEILDEKDWKRFDSDGRLFWNMNTRADYDEARRVMEVENK
jgi:molybdopterin-guanine dinucleotide biosynthesis protein A